MEYQYLVSTREIRNIKKERLKFDILGVNEVKWTGSGNINSCNWTFEYSGGEKHEAGVGLLLQKKLAKEVTAFWHVSQPVIMVKIAAKPVGLNIIQVCAPTGDHSDEDVELFYEQSDKVEEISSVKIRRSKPSNGKS